MIPWPKDEAGFPAELQLLLATATAPRLIEGGNGTPREIAECWNGADDSWFDYFLNNRRAGIVTRDDTAIIESLSSVLRERLKRAGLA